MDGRTNGRIDAWMHEQMDVRMDGWNYAAMDDWMDSQYMFIVKISVLKARTLCLSTHI